MFVFVSSVVRSLSVSRPAVPRPSLHFRSWQPNSDVPKRTGPCVTHAGLPACPAPENFQTWGMWELSARLLPPFDDMQKSDVIKCNHFLVPRAALTLNTTRYNSLRPTQNSVKTARTCPKTRHLYLVPGRQRTHVIISTALANLSSREWSSIVPELETKPVSCYTTRNLQPSPALGSPRLRVPHLEANRRDRYGRP